MNVLTTILIIIAVAIVPFYLAIRYFAGKKRRLRLFHTPLSPELIVILKKNIHPYNRLSEKIKKELQGLVNIFLDEKDFEGCGGLEITDEIRVTIAADACLLLLNRNIRDCFPDLQTILVYPSAYVARGSEMIGGRRVDNVTTARAGESWQNGAVVLSWDHVKRGVQNFNDGQNVVLHEFGHQLDQASGAANGAPVLTSYNTWAMVMGSNFEKLCEKVKKHKKDVMDGYGATNPAEFFAVATETFFEKPDKLKRDHPDLFQELLEYYNVNPMEWE